jgi:uncharacterized membrane protein YeaQ/YmgE (transglycosylase-associated protein family)
MIDLIGWIIFGLLAGIIAKALMPGKDPGGCIITMLLGIAGSLVGGYCARAIGLAKASTGLRGRGFFVQLLFAVIGAVIILVIYRLISGKRE